MAAALNNGGRPGAVIDADALAAMDALGHELTGEQEYELAQTAEQRYVLTRTGVSVAETDDPARTGREWT